MSEEDAVTKSVSSYGTLTAQANDAASLARMSSRKLFQNCKAVGGHQESQITSYDTDGMGDMTVLVWPWVMGSIFRRWRIWWQIGAYSALVIGLTALLYNTVPNPEKINYTIAQSLAAYFNVFLPFLFGIYLNNVFTRWWTMRTMGIGGLSNSLINLCVIASSHLRGAEGKDTRHLLVRYGLLSHELIYRGARRTDGDLSDLVDSGALTDEEMRALIDLPGGAKAQGVWAWIQMLMDEQFRMQRIPSGIQISVQTEITNARTAVKTIFTHLTTPMPFAYVHLMACLVHLNLLLLVLQAGMVCTAAIGKIAIIRHSTAAELEKADIKADTEACMLLFAQAVLLIMVPMLYLGYLELAYEIADPFGTDPNDFPRAMIHNTLQDECEGLFKLAEAAPKDLAAILQAGKEASPAVKKGVVAGAADNV